MLNGAVERGMQKFGDSFHGTIFLDARRMTGPCVITRGDVLLQPEFCEGPNLGLGHHGCRLLMIPQSGPDCILLVDMGKPQAKGSSSRWVLGVPRSSCSFCVPHTGLTLWLRGGVCFAGCVISVDVRARVQEKTSRCLGSVFRK